MKLKQYNFPFTKQPDSMDCGPACLSMISEYYGKRYTLEYLRDNCFIGRDGVSLLGISKAAEKIGFHTIGGRLTFDKLAEKAPLPCIVHWNQEHFVVVYKIAPSPKRGKLSPLFLWRGDWGEARGLIHVADPGKGLITYTREEFCNHWLSTQTGGEEKGVALLIEPTQLFFEQEGDKQPSENRIKFLWKYLLKYKRFFTQLILGLFIGSILQLIFPF
ncbi:MAG: cysteine peptidase family C39 domain-containing protein, partial [Petrimonas sp.]|nr:cysteine peptidase family C39 domain-containing protein [Petrimonas sp.]